MSDERVETIRLYLTNPHRRLDRGYVWRQRAHELLTILDSQRAELTRLRAIETAAREHLEEGDCAAQRIAWEMGGLRTVRRCGTCTHCRLRAALEVTP